MPRIIRLNVAKLTDEQERAIVRRLRRMTRRSGRRGDAGEIARREAAHCVGMLIHQHWNLISWIAGRWSRRKEQGILPSDERLSIAYTAAMRAIPAYRLGHDCKLSSYLAIVLRRALWNSTGHGCFGTSKKQFPPACGFLWEVESPPDRDGSLPIPDRLLTKAMLSLTARQQEVVRGMFGVGGDELTMAALATQFGLSRSRVGQIAQTALLRLRSRLVLLAKRDLDRCGYLRGGA